jgi:hypothetical protein
LAVRICISHRYEILGGEKVMTTDQVFSKPQDIMIPLRDFYNEFELTRPGEAKKTIPRLGYNAGLVIAGVLHVLDHLIIQKEKLGYFPTPTKSSVKNILWGSSTDVVGSVLTELVTLSALRWSIPDYIEQKLQKELNAAAAPKVTTRPRMPAIKRIPR